MPDPSDEDPGGVVGGPSEGHRGRAGKKMWHILARGDHRESGREPVFRDGPAGDRLMRWVRTENFRKRSTKIPRYWKVDVARGLALVAVVLLDVLGGYPIASTSGFGAPSCS